MITNEAFLAEVKKRTGCTFADLGFDPEEDLDRWIEGEESAKDAVTALISKYDLDDITEYGGAWKL